ncbi:glycosyltransferase family 39 protein [Nakamurella deserti]|uniref:glycosyltransferase family 39 protein n=1 Tax=Nakamurella deserti TaxID=2164074 RepID=UPI000DBE4782|nr:glycosyltransferase family 39 protein [Nakamurella deserti]
MTDRRYRAALALLALGSAAAAVAVHHWLFPLYSLNRDDSVYVAMSRLLQQGHATYPLDFAPFRPWASAPVGDRIVLKYSPPWPAVLAVAETLSGASWVALGVVAAAVVVLTATVTAEVFTDRAAALVAGVLAACSPAILLQSGTYLPYLFQLALGLAAVVLLLRGVRRPSAATTVAAGTVMGVAAWARPYDAVLDLVPFLVYVVIHRWRPSSTGPRWWVVLLRVAVGAAPVLLVMLAWNAAVLGDPLRLPYTVTGPQDGFGFGMRGVFPQYTSLFTAGDGVAGTVGNLGALPAWTAGGLVVIALAGVGVVRRARGPAIPLAALAVVVPLGYLPFWGPWAISEVWDGIAHFGPYYHLAVLVPLVAFAAVTLVEAARRVRSPAPRWARAALTAVVAAMVAVTVVAVPGKVAVNLAVRDDFRSLQRFVADAPLGRAVLLLPGRGDLGFDSTTPFLENRPDLDQPVLYAETRGGPDLELIDRFPDRALYRLSQQLPPGRPTGGTVVLDRLSVDTGDDVDVRVALSVPRGGTATAYLFDGTTEHRIPLDGSIDLDWTLTTLSHPGPMPTGTVRIAGGTGVVAVGLEVAGGGGVSRWERRFAYRVTADGSRLQLLRPGQGWSLNGTPGAGWQLDVADSPVTERE